MTDFSTIPPEIPKKRTGKPLTFSCPNCAGSVTVKAVGHSISAVCAYCSSVIDIANENFRILSTANERTRPTLLTIGSKGALAGILWEIVGYMEKKDASGYYPWDEYLLYNPYHGFRFLVQSQGHWSLFKILKRSISHPGISGEIKLDGIKYRRFQKGHTKVSYVKGEFYWRVRKGEESYVTDYIAPPFTLSIDQGDSDINAALGEYIEPKKIAKAFVLSKAMPVRHSVGANQPGPFTKDQLGKVWFTAIIAFAIATFIQIASSLAAPKTTVFESRFDIEPENKTQTLSTESFSIPRLSNMMVSSYTHLSNDWLELEYELINSQGESIKETKQALEYYSGYDEGYYWTEGNSYEDSLFSAVPAGEYRLLIDADSGMFQKNQPVTFNVQVKRGVSSWSNYGFTVLLLILYPCYVTFRYRYFESSRWAESDFYNKY